MERMGDAIQKYGFITYTVKGISMLPLLRERLDVVVIKRCDPSALKKYDVVLFRRDGEENKYILHRILKCNPDGSYWIVGDNLVDGETVRPDQIVGIMTAINRNGRTINMTDPDYLKYVRFWNGPWRFTFLKMCAFFNKTRKPTEK